MYLNESSIDSDLAIPSYLYPSRKDYTRHQRGVLVYFSSNISVHVLELQRRLHNKFRHIMKKNVNETVSNWIILFLQCAEPCISHYEAKP